MTQKYTEMTAGDMLQELADDGMKWAAAFREKFPEVPEDVAFGWFANAIENTWDTRCSRLTKSNDAWKDFKRQVEGHRRFWRKFGKKTDA